jgi:glycosyltransferase involved in cell wall biosynthesis
VASLSVIIPSRARSRQQEFLDNAIYSIQTQTDAEIIVAIDRDADRPYVEAKLVVAGNSQASALNAGVEASTGDKIAFLEDDDRWSVGKAESQLEALESYDFVSTNQLEVDEDGNVLRVNDFPTPSGWMMKRSTWDKVGEFDLTYRWHMDTEWLGRLNCYQFRRCHLVESTAPIQQAYMGVRPWLGEVAKHSLIVRSGHSMPLVRRLVHHEQGMMMLDQRSNEEHQRMFNCFREIPW